MSDLTQTGRTCKERAILEAERRYCGNETEFVTDGSLIITDRQLLATALDVRTRGCLNMTSAQLYCLKDVFQAACANFALQVRLAAHAHGPS